MRLNKIIDDVICCSKRASLLNWSTYFATVNWYVLTFFISFCCFVVVRSSLLALVPFPCIISTCEWPSFLVKSQKLVVCLSTNLFLIVSTLLIEIDTSRFSSLLSKKLHHLHSSLSTPHCKASSIIWSSRQSCERIYAPPPSKRRTRVQILMLM